jgi:hypothetical protein
MGPKPESQSDFALVDRKLQMLELLVPPSVDFGNAVPSVTPEQLPNSSSPYFRYAWPGRVRVSSSSVSLVMNTSGSQFSMDMRELDIAIDGPCGASC